MLADRSVRARAGVIVLSLVGVMFVLLRTSSPGLGISPDSRNYLAASSSLLAGDGYQNHDGTPYVNWPPLFPTLLAAIDAAGLDPVEAGRFANAAIMGLVIFAAGQLFRMHIASTALALLGTASVLLSWSIIRTFLRLWTEPLFTLLALLFVIYLSNFLHERKMRTLLLISVLAALAWLQRYAGLTFVLTGLVLIGFWTRDTPWRERFVYSTIFGIIAATPMVIWLVRTYVVASTLTGDHGPSSYTTIEAIGKTLRSVGNWFVPADMPFSVVPMVMVLIVGLGALTLVVLRYRRGGMPRLESVRLGTVATFIVIYSVFITVMVMSGRAFEAGDRFFSPIYVFVMFFAFLGIAEISSWSDRLVQGGLRAERLYLIFGVILILAGISFNQWTLSDLFPNRTLDETDLVAIVVVQALVAIGGIGVIALRDTLAKRWSARFAIWSLSFIWLAYPLQLSVSALWRA